MNTLFLIASTLITAPITAATSQQLALTASVAKATFFDGEPIYFLLELKNAGPDTAWVSLFSLASPQVVLSVTDDRRLFRSPERGVSFQVSHRS